MARLICPNCGSPETQAGLAESTCVTCGAQFHVVDGETVLRKSNQTVYDARLGPGPHEVESLPGPGLSRMVVPQQKETPDAR